MLAGCVIIQPTPIYPDIDPTSRLKQDDIKAYYDYVNAKAFDGKINATIKYGMAKNREWYGITTFGRIFEKHKIEIDIGFYQHSYTNDSLSLKGTIIHEMVHCHFGIAGHGPGFQAECDRVGKIMGVPSEHIYDKNLYLKDTSP